MEMYSGIVSSEFAKLGNTHKKKVFAGDLSSRPG